VQYTDGGWATEKFDVICIESRHREVAERCLCILILDVYPSRWTDLVLDTAGTNDIDPNPWIGEFWGNLQLAPKQRSEEGCGALARETLTKMKASKFSPGVGTRFRRITAERPGT
jgi:hypothetical protein